MSTLAVPKSAKRKRRKDAKPRCSVLRCKSTKLVAAGLCQKHLVRRADAAFAKAIRERDGWCVPAIYDDRDCVGGLQCCHVLSRDYKWIRFDPDNAIAGCAGHHVFYTHNPLEWEVLVDEHFGEGHRERMRAIALAREGDWRTAAIEWAAKGDKP